MKYLKILLSICISCIAISSLAQRFDPTHITGFVCMKIGKCQLRGGEYHCPLPSDLNPPDTSACTCSNTTQPVYEHQGHRLLGPAGNYYCGGFDENKNVVHGGWFHKTLICNGKQVFYYYCDL